MIALETKNLVKSFGGVHAVDHLSIELKRGTIIGLIGPNGSGKSTLVNTLSGIMPIDGGEIAVSGVELRRIEAHEVSRYGITRTFQEVRLWNQMSALDNVLVVLTERNVFGALFEKHGEYHLKKAEEVLQEVKLWEKRNELAANLSYGQRKLLEMARALAMDAEIYLFDEPFAGLFPEMVKTVSRILKNLKEREKTIVLVEHNMNLIRELCDYVFVLDSGERLAEGKPKEVLAKREVIEAYLGE